ncbi:MAG: Amidohydrolase 3 [Mycobacterium sp.]|nr:Amidohydrolase 3 [Mycobacterium sp.]
MSSPPPPAVSLRSGRVDPPWAAATGRTLYRNGRVRTPVDPFATALLVDGDSIAWVGNEQAAAGMPADTVVDLQDAVVLPAFVDAHVHTLLTAVAADGLDLSGAPTLRAALDLLAAEARRRPDGVLLAAGYDESGWPEGRPPTSAEVDAATGGRAVYLSRIDLHAGVVSAALARRTGLAVPADGLVREQEHGAVRRALLAGLDPAHRRQAHAAVRRQAAALGIGTLHEMAGEGIGEPEDLAALLALAAEEPGPLIVGYWAALGDVATSLALGLHAAGGDLFCDGSLGSHTAALAEPYADAPDTHGVLHHDREELRDHIEACVRAGLQTGFHVIGDAAVDRVLAAFEDAAGNVGRAAVVAGRHRLEHAELLSPDAIRRMASLGLVASVQPAFDAAWGGPDGMYAERLGDRAAGANPYAALAAAGVPLALSSDAPVTPLDPWGTVRAAVEHRTRGAGLSARAAFSAATRGGHRAARDDEGGVLAPGAPATFAVWEVAEELVVEAVDGRVSAWSTDPRAGTPGLPSLQPGATPPLCRQTVVAGRTVHELM